MVWSDCSGYPTWPVDNFELAISHFDDSFERILKRLTYSISGLEMPREIALTNDIGHAQPEKFGNLRYSLQDAARKDRETYLKTAVIDRSINVTASGLSECDKLLKALKKWSNSAEKLQIDHFLL